jgi:hypothetical protein
VQRLPSAGANLTDPWCGSQLKESVMEKEQLTLEPRIRAIEDRLEIYNLIAGHPPSADTGNTAYAEAVFTADAVFDRGPDLSGAVGNKAIGANLQSAGHQAAISGGWRISPRCRMSPLTVIPPWSFPTCKF